MLTMIVYYHCKPGLRDSFIESLRRENMVALCKAEDGCMQYQYSTPLEDADTLLLVEKWETEEAQKKHTTTPHFQTLSTLKSEYVDSVEIERILVP